MRETKNFCQTHHFYYNGNKCPLCEKERIDNMASRFVKPEKVENDREINEHDLEMLVGKFNVK